MPHAQIFGTVALIILAERCIVAKQVSTLVRGVFLDKHPRNACESFCESTSST